jgi:hypothetical protein
MKSLIALIAVAGLAACSYPQAQVGTVDTRPHLSIAGAPAGAQLVIDNVALGAAANYAPGIREITLDHGTHHVVITNGGTVLYNNSIYLGAGADSTITVPQ